MATTPTMARRERERPDPIDVVAIVTPNHLHLPVAAAFLDDGFDVICDKPLTTTLAEAEELVRRVEASGRVFVLSHNYTAYPMVREARAMVAAGALGQLRVVQVEYPQDWLATPLEQQGQKQAEWRTDPARSGPGGTVADIGTHAHNLACFVTGLELREVAADVNIHVPGPADRRQHPRAAAVRGRRHRACCGRARWRPATPTRCGCASTASKGGLTWAQEDPGVLHLAMLGEAPRTIARGSPTAGTAAARLTRLPDGCPEGFLEGFATSTATPPS